MATKSYDGSSTQEISFTADLAGNLLQVSNHDGWSEYRSGDDLIIFSSDETNYLRVIGAYASATKLDFIEYFVDGKSTGEIRSVSTIATTPASGLHFIAGTFENDTIDGASASSLSATGYLGNDKITGTVGRDYLGGNEGNDTIIGLDGNDVLLGGAGDDYIYGGDGIDTLAGGDGSDWLYGGVGDDTIDGGPGYDRIDFRESSASVIVKFDVGTAVGVAIGSDQIQNIERVIGSNFDDILIGSDTAEGSYEGFTGDLGNDVIDGKGGNDHVWYGRSGAGVQVNLETGEVTGGEGNDTLSSIEWVTGSNFDDILLGSDNDESFAPDTLGNIGSLNFKVGGADIIDGKGGIDSVSYTNTNATEDFSPSGITANLANGEVTDPAGNVDKLINIENIYGTAYSDDIVGDDYANELRGEEGNDNLSGGSGDDILNGGAGDDILEGGAGDDSLLGGAGADTYVYRFEDGITTITDTDQNTLHAISRTSDGTRLFGEMYFDDEGRLVIEGNELTAPNSKLIASGITDLYWTADDNSYSPMSTKIYNSNLHDLQDDVSFTFIGTHQSNTITTNTTDKYTEVHTGAGNDTIQIASSGESFIASGAGNDEVHGGSGNDIVFGDGVNNWQNMDDAVDDYIHGYQGDDELHGGNGDDTLNGGEGDDTLDGGNGDDALFGSNGDDYLDGGNGANRLDGGGGDDVIHLAASKAYSRWLSAKNVSSEFQTGTQESINLKNFLKTEDVVDGGADADTIHLDSGNIALFLHDAFSAFHNDASLSKDSYGNKSVQRIDNIENIYGYDGDNLIDLTSPDYSMAGQNIKISGGNGDDIIWGSDADENILGDAGNDVLFGGAGTNILTGGAGADEFQFTHTSVADTISDYSKADGDVLKFYVRSRSPEAAAEFSINGNQLVWGDVAITLDGYTSLTGNDLTIKKQIIGTDLVEDVELAAGPKKYTIPGNVVKGPLQGAIAFIDANGNSIPDAGEVQTTTLADGSYILEAATATARVVVVATDATIDMSSGAAISDLIMSAPAGATVVTPLTTLLDASSSLTVSKLQSAVGITFDPLTFNPFADGVDPAQAIAAEKVAQEIMTIVKTVSKVSGGDAAGWFVSVKALAEALETAGDSGMQFDFADEDAITTVLNAAAAETGQVISAANITILARSISNLNFILEDNLVEGVDLSSSEIKNLLAAVDQYNSVISEIQTSQLAAGTIDVAGFDDIELIKSAIFNLAPTDISLSSLVISANTTNVGVATATDGDSEDIVYELLGDDKEFFSIDKDTGVITVDKNISAYDSKSEFSIVIKASDFTETVDNNKFDAETDVKGKSYAEAFTITKEPLIDTTGVVVKGPLQNALVFADLNDNGVYDGSEPSAITAADGSYTLSSIPLGADLIALTTDTTIDTSTGTALDNFIMSAPASSTVITPITTLAQETGLTTQELSDVLGLPEIDIFNFNAFESGVDLNKALETEVISHQIATIVRSFSAAQLSQASAGIYQSLDALSNVLTEESALRTTVDLSDQTFLEKVALELGLEEQIIATVVSSISNLNNTIASVSDLTSDTTKSTFATSGVLVEQILSINVDQLSNTSLLDSSAIVSEI